MTTYITVVIEDVYLPPLRDDFADTLCKSSGVDYKFVLWVEHGDLSDVCFIRVVGPGDEVSNGSGCCTSSGDEWRRDDHKVVSVSVY